MMRCVVAVLATALSMSAAFAAAGSAALPPPDPTARNLTPREIQKRAQDACEITQARLASTTSGEVAGPCACYARGTIRAMNKDEIEAFRATGYFNDSAREKALGFIDKCGLKRP